jgi:hypothetical protein
MAYRIRAVLILVALAAALVPLPAAWIERVYSGRIYPAIQPWITSFSNLLPVALLDVSVLALAAGFAALVVRDSRRLGWRGSARRAVVSFVTVGAAIYILFLASWGLNYRRVPIEGKVDFERARISQEAARHLAALAVARLNAGHQAAHARPFQPEALQASFGEAQRILGAEHLATPGRAKRSLLGLYFRYAAVDGMTVPVFLEIILNPDVLPVERPSVLAHEWAHLAGYANESEANFVAWLAGVRSADPVAQYSAWMDAYRLALGVLPRQVRASVPSLDEGPREDLRAIAARYARASPVVRSAARGVYDSYLKANRVEAGIQSYELALQLMLGTRFDEGWTPRLRRAGAP